MGSFSLLAWALLGGCGIGTVVYAASRETTLKAKGIVAGLYVLSWIIDLIIRTESISFGFLIQIGLCLYFAFWHKLSQL